MNNSETSLSITQHTITASAPIWHEITSNKTSVFLHVLLVRSTPIAHTGSTEANATISAVSYPEIVNTKSLQTGQALYGVVRLVKQARIPKHFHHRHLLADWGLVNTTEIEGTIPALHTASYLILYIYEALPVLVLTFCVVIYMVLCSDQAGDAAGHCDQLLEARGGRQARQ